MLAGASRSGPVDCVDRNTADDALDACSRFLSSAKAPGGKSPDLVSVLAIASAVSDNSETQIKSKLILQSRKKVAG